MLNRVCHARHSILIAEVAHIDVKSGTGLVRLRVVNQQSLELVFQPHYAVIAVIQRGLLQAVGQDNDRRLATGGLGLSLDRRRHTLHCGGLCGEACG